MTTEMQLLRAPNLFVDNEVYLLGRDVAAQDMELAGAAWIMERQPVKVAHRLTLQHASTAALAKLDGYSLWLLAGHKVWQPESRITRYRNWKLWEALRHSGLVVPFGHDMGEYPMETQDGLHYFGALQLGLGSLEHTAAILEAESLAHLVALHPKHTLAIETLIQNGWALPRRSNAPSWEVLKDICRSDGVVFWPVGAFDDIEAGTVAFANAAVLERVLGS